MCHNERDVWICVKHLSSGWKFVSLALKNLRHSITKTTFSLLLMLSKSVVLPSFTSSEARSPSTHLSDIHFYSDSLSHPKSRHAMHPIASSQLGGSQVQNTQKSPQSLYSAKVFYAAVTMPCHAGNGNN